MELFLPGLLELAIVIIFFVGLGLALIVIVISRSKTEQTPITTLGEYPYPASEAVRSIAVGVLATLLTCGIYGLYWQYKQMDTLNAWLKRDEYSFWLWLFLTIITCGLFALYYEYKMAMSISQ